MENVKHDFCKKSKANLKRKLLRWSITGGLSNSLDFFLFISIYSITSYVEFSNFVSTFVSLLLSYFLHYYWSFNSSIRHKLAATRFVLNLSFWWLVATLMIKSLINFGIDYRLAKVIPLSIIAPLNFFVLNKLVFTRLPSK